MVRIFLDTSALLKRYLEEEGSQELEVVLKESSEVIVAPVAWIESISALSRLLREKGIDHERFSLLKREIKNDFHDFNRVLWSDALEEKAVEIVEDLSLKTLDGIQLAAGILSHADLFITSDNKLLKAAKKVLKNVRGIGL